MKSYLDILLYLKNCGWEVSKYNTPCNIEIFSFRIINVVEKGILQVTNKIIALGESSIK
jgi:hypothetical protein